MHIRVIVMMVMEKIGKQIGVRLRACRESGRAAAVLSFLMPAAVMLVIFVVKGIFPFGERSFLTGDLYHQYMPFFSELVHRVRAGENLSFSYNVGIGSNFLALFVYYLASPLNVFGLLVPEEYLIEFLSYMTVVKVGLCGFTCFLYLRKHFGEEGRAGNGALLFSCFYALSGFMAAYNYNVMWVDCVVLFPLIILGLERLTKEGRCGLYCVTLGLSIFTNYYISIMICIFLVLYFLVMLVEDGNCLRNIGRFVLFSLLAGGMAAALLIPEVLAILETDFGDMDFPKTVESYFSVLDMLARHCLCVYTERGLDHWPNIYCGSAALMFVPLYLMNKKISAWERFSRMALCLFLLISFSTNILDFIWHGLNYPDSLPARQSFIYIFLVLFMCYDALRHVKDLEGQQIVYGFLAAFGFLLFVEKFVDHEDFELGIELLTLLFVALYAVLLYLYRTRESLRLRKGIAVLALAAVFAECLINTYDTSVGTVSRSDYLRQEADYKALYAEARKQDDGFYRMEKFDRRTKNDGTLTGYPTASVFSSTLNSYVMDMYRILGMRHSKVYYAFDGATALVSALLNVNYMFGGSDKYENTLYTLCGSSGDVYLYECSAVLPFGYVGPKGFDIPDAPTDNGIRVQERMLSELGVKDDLFRRVKTVGRGDDVQFTPDREGIYYGFVDNWGTGSIDYIGGSTEKESFRELTKGSIFYMGYLREGQTVTLTNGDEKDESPKVSAVVYQMNEKALREALEILSARHLENVVWKSDRIEGELSLQEPGRLILSVPCEAGWTVLVNGEKTEPLTFGGCLMALDLEPGEYRLELSYVPAGTRAGLLVSAVSVAVFAAVMLIGGRMRRRRKEKPEDECLFKQAEE